MPGHKLVRGTSQGMPEILKAYERDGLYFGAVRATVSSEVASFEFGVEYRGYIALKQILQTRPFDLSPGTAYRYFFNGSYGRKKLNVEPATIQIRIEQNEAATTRDFDCPTSLASNLRWFLELTDFAQASALKRLPELDTECTGDCSSGNRACSSF
jgi:hypothetical protein